MNDARTIRARLAAHGQVTAHRDGRFCLRLVRPAEEGYHTLVLWRVVVREIPGARLILWRVRRAADRYFEIHEVLFRVGPNIDAPSAPSGAPTRRATSAGTAGGGSGHSFASVSSEDVTAGRDRHFDLTLGPGPELHSGLLTCNHMEGNADEVERGDRAVAPPARLCESPGRRPGSIEGPGRVSPGDVVGREARSAA